MTVTTLCALTPQLCRLSRDAVVRRAVSAFSGGESDARHDALSLALRAHPEDATAAVSLLGGSDLTTETIRQCFDREALAFFHICGQCSPAEVLQALCQCHFPPTMDALAQLIAHQRQQQAMTRYALQLMWRICGDEALPDALSLFPEEDGGGAPGGMPRTLRPMKGGAADD